MEKFVNKIYEYIETNYLKDFCNYPSDAHIFFWAYAAKFGEKMAYEFLADTVREKEERND